MASILGFLPNQMLTWHHSLPGLCFYFLFITFNRMVQVFRSARVHCFQSADIGRLLATNYPINGGYRRDETALAW